MGGLATRHYGAMALVAGLLLTGPRGAGAGTAVAQDVPPYDTGLLDHPAPPAASAPAAAPAAAAPGEAVPAPAPPETMTVPPHPDTVPGILGAARQLAASGQAVTASQLVEEAETRLLDRSVEVGTGSQPIETPLISALGAARRALDAGQTAEGTRILDDAIAHLPPIEPPQ